MIKYGMSLEYLPEWGVQEALREIYQNFQDFGDYTKSIIKNHNSSSTLHLSNNYNPGSLEFLKVGKSEKRDDSSTIGEHGEGLKMALMVLHREGCKTNVRTGRILLTPTTYKDDDLGECFGLNKTNIIAGSNYENLFAVKCEVPSKDLETYGKKQLTDEDILHECYYGQLLKDKPGQVYVEGMYVCTEKDLRNGYNFKAEYIYLDRDRCVPKAWDVNWYAARILESYKQIKEEDLSSRDCIHVNDIPESLQKKFSPRLTTSGIILFETKKGTVASKSISDELIERPENKKKIQKLKYNMTKKRVPHTILQEFKNNYNHILNAEACLDFDNLILKAKGWKISK